MPALNSPDLRAEETDIPQLKRVIVSDGERLAMEPTLDEALHVVFGERPRERAGPVAAQALPGIDLDQARRNLDRAEQALGRGDWGRPSAARCRSCASC